MLLLLCVSFPFLKTSPWETAQPRKKPRCWGWHGAEMPARNPASLAFQLCETVCFPLLKPAWIGVLCYIQKHPDTDSINIFLILGIQGQIPFQSWQIYSRMLHSTHIQRECSQQFIVTGFPWWLSGKESTCQAEEAGLVPVLGKIPWRRKWQLTPVFLPEKFYGQSNLVGYTP